MNNTMGLNGGPSKCARFYVDMMECAKAAGRNDHFLKCKNEREDYNECLHNRKLVSVFSVNFFPIIIIEVP